MAQDEILVSADSHVLEDPQLWKQRLPAALRDRAPEFPALKVGGNFQARPGGHNPKFRVGEMAQDGVSAEVLYPSFGLDLFGLTDVALQEACFRVYNDWITEFCAEVPGRLFGIGTLSVYNIDNAILELERCKLAGLRGVLIWQAPPPELTFIEPHYERLWAAAEEMDMPINMHILTGHPFPFPRNFGPPIAWSAFRSGANRKLLYVSD